MVDWKHSTDDDPHDFDDNNYKEVSLYDVKHIMGGAVSHSVNWRFLWGFLLL